MTARLDDARLVLARWGRWWRWKEQQRSGYAPVSPSYQLMELARLGCMVQGGKSPQPMSDDIAVPDWVADIDAMVTALPPRQQAIVTQFYVRSHNLPRRKVRARSLVLGEERVAAMMASGIRSGTAQIWTHARAADR
ncbi:MAG: hypothetical protein FKY71_19300 [Spiribacter salinus]|uniref:Antitermination protein Q n=1 Tax=Spiribacter salinus TaxID=1335746 RepID=A0A540V7J3_9GAMM|nr:MAG: hypothetical protein FKY71_19300 [Spiribacter salinus]